MEAANHLNSVSSLASAIPIRDIWKQKHHKAINACFIFLWIPSPLVDSFLIRCLSRMSFQPKIMLCKDIEALSSVLQMSRAHDYFQRFHNGNMKGGPEGEGSWTVIHKYSSQCVLALYVKLIPLQRNFQRT